MWGTEPTANFSAVAAVVPAQAGAHRPHAWPRITLRTGRLSMGPGLCRDDGLGAPHQNLTPSVRRSARGEPGVMLVSLLAEAQ
jgi:hypothetical protein